MVPDASSVEQDETEELVVSVSTSFCPGAHPLESDVIFCSSDGVLFYLHSQVIVTAAPNAFFAFLSGKGSIVNGGPISIPESSTTLNIILHTLYGTSCAQNSPSLDDLIQAVDRMPFHGIAPQRLIVPKTPLYMLLLSYAPLRPIEVYALAGFHCLEELAVHVSSHLLSFPLSTISDELATRIGSVYLKRLFLLHVHRLDALKDALLQPPHPHAPTKECTFAEQKKLTRAWALASSYLVWDATPDVSTHRIQSALSSLVKGISCKECENSANARMREVVVKWAAVKCTV
ncbi:hypothetical protein CC2G_008096 [Coprinopsis cinerea AmutBmut pab1-1]|nr:hypothetical protein CC2G_008096 [Coprinopsis cinerea AmutBmut pab1-1]